jgi:hypothetical protein
MREDFFFFNLKSTFFCPLFYLLSYAARSGPTTRPLPLPRTKSLVYSDRIAYCAIPRFSSSFTPSVILQLPVSSGETFFIFVQFYCPFETQHKYMRKIGHIFACPVQVCPWHSRPVFRFACLYIFHTKAKRTKNNS